MILLDCRILGFGKLRDVAFDFLEGINLVYASNEGGKSTLQRFLVGMLFGQLRSDLKMQRRLDSWVERYKPWLGQEYGGMLRLRLADGREMELRRAFGKDESRIEIRTATGEDITRRYEQQRNGEVLFSKHHCGLPKELFESVGVIRETAVSEIDGRETIRDRIANLAHSGDEELSVRRSLSVLEDALEAVGSERAPTKPYRQTMDLVESLEAEKKSYDERRLQFQDWLEEKKRVAGEAADLGRRLSAVKTALSSARRRDMAARIEALEDIDRDIAGLRLKIDALGAREDFPVDLLDELNRMAGARDSIVRRLEEIRAKKEDALSALDGAEADRRELSAYAPLLESGEADRITERFVGYMSLSLQKDGLKKTCARLRNEADDLEKRLKKLAPALRDAETDWQGFAREAAEDEQDASRRGAELSEKTAREKEKLAKAMRASFSRRWIAVLVVVLAATPFGLRALAGLESVPEWLAYGSGAVCLALAVLVWIMAGKSMEAGREAERGIKALELDQDRIREGGELKRKKLDDVIAKSGFQGLDDFLAAARRAEQDRLKLADLISRLEESEAEGRRQNAESEEIYGLLKESLAKVGLSCSPGNLKFQIDQVRTSLRRYRELDARYMSCLQRADALKAEEAALGLDYEDKHSRIRSLLDRAAVETPERFQEECSKRQRSIELLEKAASREREFGRLAEGRTLDEWRESLSEMEALAGAGAADASDGRLDDGDASGAPLLPYLPTIPELEGRERDLASRLSDALQRQARAAERVRQAFQNYRPYSEIEEDLACARAKFLELERNRAALNLAIGAVEALSRQQQEVLAPQLNAAVERRFLRLCGRRYEEVKIDPDFQVWVREAHSGELRPAECLSRGTQDQLYFALRFGILDLLSDENESCPCLLDEPFAAYDRPRMREAYDVLADESGRRQLILFTCREDLLEIARLRGSNVIELNV